MPNLWSAKCSQLACGEPHRSRNLAVGEQWALIQTFSPTAKFASPVCTPFPCGTDPCPLPPFFWISLTSLQGCVKLLSTVGLGWGQPAPTPLHGAGWCTLHLPQVLDWNHQPDLACKQTGHYSSSPLGKKVGNHWLK